MIVNLAAIVADVAEGACSGSGAWDLALVVIWKGLVEGALKLMVHGLDELRQGGCC